MRNTILSNKQIYHIYNRGVDKRNIFLNKNDYQRFVNSLIVFNDTEGLNGRHFKNSINGENRNILVNIIAYCLMPNHFHLLLEQVEDEGITCFIKKLTISYAMYFNKKYNRTGALIQGTFKRSHIKSNDRLLEMSRYIHANPMKLFDKTTTDKKELLSYVWSSLPIYAGISDDLRIVSNQKIILEQFKSPDTYIRYILESS